MRSTVTKNCEWCGVEFTQETVRKPRFCGRKCAAQWRSSQGFNGAPSWGPRFTPRTKECEQCGQSLRPYVGRHHVRKDARFCSRKCRAVWRISQRPEKKCERCGAELSPKANLYSRFCNRYECKVLGRRKAVYSEEVRKKRSEHMRELMKRPEVQSKLVEHRRNIFWPEVWRKSVEKQRELGFPNLKSVPGPTVPQKILFDALPGAVMEFGLSGSGRTKNLCVDIAVPALKLAIEVDGLSHTKRKEKECDARKAQFLKERGWTLLRFWNKEIVGDLPSVLARIQAIAPLQKAG